LIMRRALASISVAVIGAGWWRVQPELGAQQLQPMTLEVADRHAAPAVGGADHGREHEFHRRPLAGEPADHLGAAALLDERALGQVRGAYPDAVPDRNPVDSQQRVQVVFEAATAAGNSRGVVALGLAAVVGEACRCMGPASEARRELGDGSRQRVVVSVFGGDLLVSPAQVLLEGMTSREGSG
jgi:hypothetical protein